MARRSRKRSFPEPFEAVIESLSHEGRGICHYDGKVVFVFAALPGEKVRLQITHSAKKYMEAKVLDILDASPDREKPRCEAFGICGGCSMQHLSSSDQLEIKQQALREQLDHHGIVVKEWLPPLTDQSWGYRRKARLGVKYVHKKQRLLIGFRERNKPYLTDMQSCEVLDPRVGKKLPLLMKLIEGMEARETIPQIEVACDDSHCTLIFRHLEPLSNNDTELLVRFAADQNLWIQTQSGGQDTVAPLFPEEQKLTIKPLSDDSINIQFRAGDFTQVNAGLNQLMVKRALDFLDLHHDDKVLDLFCGLGNFTLAMAQNCRQVTGVEGSEMMVQRAEQNSRENGIGNTLYHACDLTQVEGNESWLQQKYHKVLLDPPRSGALEVLPHLISMGVETILYVSCNPSSLVRDAIELCNGGYHLSKLGVMDMFPQTAHVESMAVFKKSI